MINMETPKCRKHRKLKGSLEKKKHLEAGCISDTRRKKHRGPETSTADSTPPRISKSVIIERGQQEIRGVEWQYHGKFVESDIPIVWGSPHGSPVVNTVKAMYESPVSRSKRRSPRIACKKLNSDEVEPPEFLNEILALSETIKAEEKNNKSSEKSDHGGKESAEYSKIGSELDESLSKYFDEDGNDCLLQYSQELEKMPSHGTQQMIQNISENHSSENQENTRCVMNTISSRSKSVSNKTSYVVQVNDKKDVKMKSPRIGTKNYVHCKHKTNTYIFQGRVLGSRSCVKTLNLTSNVCEDLKVGINQQKSESSLELKSHTSVKDIEKTFKSNKQFHKTFDNSFETIKESFLNDDLEILSSLPDDLETAPCSENSSFCPKKPDKLSYMQKKQIELQKSFALEDPTDFMQQKKIELKNSFSLEDSTDFEEGVLEYLDTIESNVASSQPMRCTPEEIEKKRQEAKLKLQKNNFSLKK